MRKRLMFETLHLDVEGGVGERRTTPSTNMAALEAGTLGGHDYEDQKRRKAEAPAVEVGFETPKQKKRVAFEPDGGDLY
jgi:elongator complex protein 4